MARPVSQPMAKILFRLRATPTKISPINAAAALTMATKKLAHSVIGMVDQGCKGMNIARHWQKANSFYKGRSADIPVGWDGCGNVLYRHLITMTRKKILYVPGLISLIGLPILLWIMGPQERIRHNCIKLFLPQDKKPLPDAVVFSRNTVMTAIKGKKIIPVEFWYDLDDPIETFNYNNKLNFVLHEIERITYTHDTTSVLKVCLGDGISYGDFIGIFNQLILHRVKRYALIDNELYIFGEPLIAPSPLELEVDAITPSIISSNDDKPSAWHMLKVQVQDMLQVMTLLLKHNYILISGFILLIFIPFTLKIRNRNKLT